MREREFNISNQVEKQFVVYSIITPNSDIRVYVGDVAPMGNGSTVLEDMVNSTAEVYIISEESKVKAIFKEGLYIVKKEYISIIPGNSYSIEVMVEGKVLKSKTTVPKDIVRWSDAKYHLDPEYDDYKFHFRATINNSTDYYCLAQSKVSYDYWMTYLYDPDIKVQKSEVYNVVSNAEIKTNADYSYFGNFDVVAAHYLCVFKSANYMLITYDKNISEAMANLEFYKSIEFTPSSGFDVMEVYSGIPPTYTNIENGYGFFGAFRKHEYGWDFLEDKMYEIEN